MPFDPKAQYQQLIAEMTQEVIDLLKAQYKPGAIYIGPFNLSHIQTKHQDAYDKYIHQMPSIIANPDHIAKHPKDGSVQYIKRMSDLVLVAVRASGSGVLFARSLYIITEATLEDYRKSGTLHDWPKKCP